MNPTFDQRRYAKVVMSTTTTVVDQKQSGSPPSKIVLVTGATGEIGKVIALQIAHAGHTVLLGCRNKKLGEQLANDIIKKTGNKNVIVELIDVSSKKLIAEFAKSFTSRYHRLDVLINNAAVVPHQREITNEGLELQFATNIYAYYALMTQLYLPLKAGSPSRIVNVASNYAGDLDLSDLQFIKRPYDKNKAYMQSKQADRMLTYAAANLFAKDKISVNACHPGVVTSTLLGDLGFSKGWESAEQGASTPIFLAIDPSIEGETGFFWDKKVKKNDSFSKNREAITALWEFCAQI